MIFSGNKEIGINGINGSTSAGRGIQENSALCR